MPWCGFCDRFFSDCEFGTEGYCEGCSSWLKEKGLLEEKQVYCRNRGCYQKVRKEEKLCSNCKNDKDAVRLTSCDTCYLNYRYREEITKCRYHSKYCLSCSNKIPEYSYYCSEHANSCLTCSSRIASGRTYCSVHQEHQEQENLKTLVRQRTSLSNPQEVIRFNTWWNNNCATVINGNSSYTLWVLVYEPAERNRIESLQKFEISNGYDRYSLTSAKNKVSSIRNELNGENPILTIHPQANSYVSFGSLVASPYVIKNGLPYSHEPGFFSDRFGAPTSAESHLKPLDIVWIKRRHRWLRYTFYHVGVYLGEDLVCHLDDDGVKITSWRSFLEAGHCEDLIRYHPIIPFKNYKDIIRQAAWAKDNNFRKGSYDLANRNCEHFANMLVYGINYSEQAYSNFPLGNNTAKLIDEIRDTANLLGQKSDNETREYQERYLQEVPVKNNCQIM